MRRYSYILSLFFMLILSISGAAQTSYTLRDCVNQGIDKNFNILMAKNELGIAENSADILNSDFLPSLSFRASHDASWDATDITTHDDVSTHTDAYYIGASSIGLYLNWTIFDGMSNAANFERFKAQMQLQDIQTMIAVEDFILSMSQEYYTYIALKQRLNVQKQILTLSAERMRIAKIKYESGSSSNIELLQARVDYNNDSTSLIETKQNLDLQRIILNDLMMMDDLQLNNWDIATDKIVCNANLSYDELWNSCLNKNSSLLLAQKQTDVTIIDIKSCRSNFYPSLDLSGGYSYLFNQAANGSYKTRKVSDPNIGLTLSIPLVNTKNIQSLKNAKLTKLNSELAQKEMERQLKLEFTSNWIEFRNYLNLIELEENNLLSSKASLDAASLQYKQSQISGLQLREAQNSYLQDQYDLLEVNLNAKMQEVYLIFMAGNSTSLY